MTSEIKQVSGDNLPRSSKHELGEVVGNLKHTLFGAYGPAMQAFANSPTKPDFGLGYKLQDKSVADPFGSASMATPTPAGRVTAAQVELSTGFADGFREETYWDGNPAPAEASNQRATMTGATLMSHISPADERPTGYVELGQQAMAPPSDQDKYLEIMSQPDIPLQIDRQDESAQRIAEGQAGVAAVFAERESNPQDQYRLAA